jgi:hypothetical protein
MCIGGPALVYYVTPSEEELFSVSPPPNHARRKCQKLTHPSDTTPNFRSDRSRGVKRSRKISTTLLAD